MRREYFPDREECVREDPAIAARLQYSAVRELIKKCDKKRGLPPKESFDSLYFIET